MGTTFGSLNIVNSGLFAAKRSLDIVNHNIVNTNTEGYSRQKIRQKAEEAFYGDPRGVVGAGVNTYDVYRVRSEYLDSKYWGQNKSYQQWTTKNDGLEEIAGIFNEPSNTGIRKVIDDFFDSLEELSKKPGESTNRVAVAEKASTLATTLNRNGNELINSIREVNTNIKSKVQEVNTLANEIAAINKQIYSFEIGGNTANDLRDQRGVLIDKLSGLVNINVSENPDSFGHDKLSISIGGTRLVDHDSTNEILLTDNDVPGLTDLGAGRITSFSWKGMSGQSVDINNGELKGLLDLRDGDGQGNNYRGYQYYLRQLNDFAKDFTEEFNEQHKNGVDSYGNIGIDFFDTSNQPVNCINFKVNSKISEDSKLIAASTIANGQSNNVNTGLLIDFRKRTDVFKNVKGTSEDFIKSFISALSVDGSQAERMMNSNEAMVAQTENKRISESGVLWNEEMSNMISYSEAYRAAAQMLTTLDEILETTISKLGLAGR